VSEEASAPPRRLPAARAVALAAGVLLVAVFAAGLAALPRGVSEFAYAPDLFVPLPFAAMRGFTVEQLASHALRVAVLGPGLLLLWWGALPLVRGGPGPDGRGAGGARREGEGRGEAPNGREGHSRVAGRGSGDGDLAADADGAPGELDITRTAWLAAGAALLLSCAWWLWLDGRVLVDDELTYRMQGELLADGRLAESRVPRWGHEAFTIWTERGATGKYLFGEPLVQAAGALLGAPTLFHLPLAAVTLLAWAAAVRRRAGDRVAAWATVLVAWSPMFLFTTPSGLSHATALAALALVALGYEQLHDERPRGGALLLGASLGFLLTVRPQVAVAAGAVLGGVAAWRLLRGRQVAALALLLGGGLAWVVGVGVYNRALTGSALQLPWNLYHPLEGFGFGQPIEGSAYRHGFREAFENLAVSAVRFNAWWLGWPISLALLLLPRVRGRGGPRRPAFRPRLAVRAGSPAEQLARPGDGGATSLLGPWPVVTAALIAVHLPYYSPGISDTGPVYYYELLLPASLAGALGVVGALARWGAKAALLLGLCFVLGTGSFLVEQGARLVRLIETLHAPAAAIVASVEPPALLLYESSPQEAIRLGWLFSFPLRERRLDGPLLTFPRGTPEQAAALRRRFPERACWYYRVEPRQLAPQLLRCEEAEALLARPRPLPGAAMYVPSTARRWGLVGE
jgi:hypothetical protein